MDNKDFELQIENNEKNASSFIKHVGICVLCGILAILSIVVINL